MKHQITEYRTSIQEKREEFKVLSAEMLLKVKAGEFATINEALLNFYASQGHTEIHSFNGWIKKQMMVKRGEKALLLWGTPSKYVKVEGDKEKNFFPLAYVFSQLQVQPLKDVAPTAPES